MVWERATADSPPVDPGFDLGHVASGFSGIRPVEGILPREVDVGVLVGTCLDGEVVIDGVLVPFHGGGTSVGVVTI